MRRAGKHALALLIVFCMMISLMPITASAGGNNFVYEVGETHSLGFSMVEQAVGQNICANEECEGHKRGEPLIYLATQENGFQNYRYYENRDDSEPAIIGDFQLSIVPVTTIHGCKVDGYELVCSFTTLRPGYTELTLETEYSYQYPGRDVECPLCGETTTLPPDMDWKKDSITIYIDVNGTHTVIYNDGVDGEEIFPDDVHTPQHSTKTPEFTGGTPSREGYRFVGWEPEPDYSVIRDITYRAIWEPVAVTAWDQLSLSTEIVNGGSVKPGDTLTYKTTVSNNTGGALTGIVVDEAVDGRLTYVGATGDGSYDEAFCTWNIPSLAAGASAVLTIEAKVQEGLADGTVITNRAAITGADAGEGDTLPASIGSSAQTTVYADPTPAPEAPNDATLTVLLKDAVTVTCADTTAGHTDGTWSALPGAYSVGPVTKEAAADSSYYTCEVTIPAEQYVAEYNKTQPGHSLKEGESAEKTVKLKYNASSWAVMSGVPVIFQTTCAQTPTPPGKVDWEKLTITTSCEGTTTPGGSVTFTTTVTNNTGKDLDNVEVAVTLDGNLTYLGLRAADYNAETGIWRVGALAKGEQAVLHVATNVKKGTAIGTRLQNNAAIVNAAAEGEKIPENMRASGKSETIVNETPEAPDEATVTELLKEAVLIKCANTSAGHRETKLNVLAGTYTLGTVTKDSSGAFLCDVKIQASKFVAAYGSLVGKTHSLVSGEAKEKTIRLKYDADKWTVQSAVPVAFYVTCTQTPRPEPVAWDGLSIRIEENKVIASPGESITYTVTVKNDTGRTLEDVIVSEVLDQNLTFDSSTWTKNSTYDKKTGLWTISDLEDGAAAVLTVKGIVALDTADDTQILNVANITQATADTGETMPEQKLSNMVRATVRRNAATRPLTLTYDANGGTNAPARQEVDVYLDTAEVQLRVSEHKPSRLGYYFQGWSTTKNGRVQYRGGDWITISGNTTLYAVWVKPTASPRTGDTSNLALWSALAGVSVTALGAAAVLMRRKTKKTRA